MKAETLSIGREIRVEFKITDLSKLDRIELFRWLVEDMQAYDVCGFDKTDEWDQLFRHYITRTDDAKG